MLKIGKITLNAISFAATVSFSWNFIRAFFFQDGKVTSGFSLDPGFAASLYFGLIIAGLYILIHLNFRFFRNVQTRRKNRRENAATHWVAIACKASDMIGDSRILSRAKLSEMYVYIGQLRKNKILPKTTKLITIDDYPDALEIIIPKLEHDSLKAGIRTSKEYFKHLKKWKRQKEKQGGAKLAMIDWAKGLIKKLRKLRYLYREYNLKRSVMN